MHETGGPIYLLRYQIPILKLVSQATIQSNSRAASLPSQAILKIPTFNHNSGCSLEMGFYKGWFEPQVKQSDP